MSNPLSINWPSDGIIPAVIQDAESRDVLMVGFLNREALERTRETGLVHFWSRSRSKLWKKGETSGHIQRVHDIFVNCDQNSLLIEVTQLGAVCHDGYPTCYYRRLEEDNSLEIVRDRWFDPADVYGGENGLHGLTRLWWCAYEYLRDTDLSNVSGTSMRLRDKATSLVPRIVDEMLELAGVLDGTHVHDGQQDDFLLEASQACYWIASELIRIGVPFSDVRPDRALDIAEDAGVKPATMARLVQTAAKELDAEALSPEEGHSLFALVANAALAVGQPAREIIERDLSELRSRDYLEPYFSR
jgi:phosphoribosyl-AMP cyclohydrolase